MKIYNEDKTQELIEEDIDLSKGYLKEVIEPIYHEAKEQIEEIGHWETLQEYPNGGKDVAWIVDTPGQEAQEAYTTEETYQLYILYTEEELDQITKNTQVQYYKELLYETDYLAIKYAEGMISEADYIGAKANREMWRCFIRQLTEADYSSDYTPEEIRDNILQEYYKKDSKNLIIEDTSTETEENSI